MANRRMGEMGPQTVQDWGASLQAPPGGYEKLAMQTTPTADAPVVAIPAEQRIQMTAAQTAAARAPQTVNWSKYALIALVGLGVYFMFIKKPVNDNDETRGE